MITETPNSINITELTFLDPDTESEMYLRKKLFEYCSSDEVKTKLLDKWQTFPQTNSLFRILDAALLVMLFPDVRAPLQLDHDDLLTIVNPPKQYTANGWKDASTLDRINLHGAGKILFPRELGDLNFDRDTYTEELDKLSLEFTQDPRNLQYQYAFAISEKVLHKNLYPESSKSYPYGDQLLEYFHDFYDLRHKGFRTIDLYTMPGLAKILYPEKASEFHVSEYDVQRVMGGIPDSPILDFPGLSVLLAKSMAAEAVTIDEKGAHFTPPKTGRIFDTSTLPERRKF